MCLGYKNMYVDKDVWKGTYQNLKISYLQEVDHVKCTFLRVFIFVLFGNFTQNKYFHN